MEKLVLAMDIGGTNVPFGLVNNRGQIIQEWSIKMNELHEPDVLVARIVEEMKESRVDTDRIVSVGIGAPNGNYYSGAIEFAPNLPWKGFVPIAEIFKKAFNISTYVTNDANAAAIGEMLYGSAIGRRNFLMITLGTGVGSAFVCNGKLVYGHDGFAGELGHVIVREGGRLCGCGRKGCLETYASATGVSRTAKRFLVDTTMASALRNINSESITSKMVVELVLKQDELALAVVDYTAKELGLALANAVAISSPEIIVFSGGLARAGDILLEPIKAYMEEYLFAVFKGKVKLVQSGLLGKNVAVLGAAALAWNELNNDND